MILNARQIHFKEDTTSELFPPIIMLAIEDVTEMMSTAEKLAAHVKDFETMLTERTLNLESVIGTLQKEIIGLKNTQKNSH